MRVSKRAQHTFHKSAKEWMVDRVAIYRRGDMEIDSTTNISQPTLGEKIYEGQARIRPTRGPREKDIGEGVMVHRDADVNIPHDATLPYRDDYIQVLDSEDTPLVGQWLRILDVRLFSQQMMRQMSVTMDQPSRLHDDEHRWEVG